MSRAFGVLTQPARRHTRRHAVVPGQAALQGTVLLQNIGGFLPLRQLQASPSRAAGAATRAVRVALLGKLGGCEGLSTWPERRPYKLCLAKQALVGDYAAGYAGFRNTTVREPSPSPRPRPRPPS